jgi:hypothetical protein
MNPLHGTPHANSPGGTSSSHKKPRLLVFGLLIFLVALGVRLLTWQDNRLEVGRVQTYVTADYKHSAQQLARGDFKAFVSDLNHLEHPPGYPILLAIVFKLFGESDKAIQLVQICIDSCAAVLLFLIALELLPAGAAIIAGLLAGLSRQFSYYAVLLLPDSLAGVPILLAVYLLARARKQPRWYYFLGAGALVGVSCWLRANALFLAPFLAVLAGITVPRGKRLPVAAAIIGGTVLVIAPITIKNALVFHRFIPLSLGAGQTLLEGIAEYDEEGRFGIPKTDLGIMRQEAELYGKPEYAQWLFGSDGIERDRMRIARGLRVVGAHPVWFLGVMAHRATSSIRLDPVPVLARESPLCHSFGGPSPGKLVWKLPSVISENTNRSARATFTLVDDGMVRLIGDETTYGTQFESGEIQIEKYRDYVFHLPLKLEEGRVLLKVTDAGKISTLATTGLDVHEGVGPRDQPVKQVSLPFVSATNDRVCFVFANNAPEALHPVALVGAIELFELGDSSYHWLRYFRIPLRTPQRIFTTAWMLPLTLVGILLLARTRRWQTLALLLIVPAYYLTVQSALHTERRYVYVIQFFFLLLASYSIWWLGKKLASVTRLLRRSRPEIV